MTTNNAIDTGNGTTGQILQATTGGAPTFTSSLNAVVQVPVNSLNSGTGASATTYFSGAGTWTTPGASAGSIVKIATLTAANSATLSFSQCFSATYTKYLIVMEGVVPVSAAVGFLLVLGFGGTPTYVTSGYNWTSVSNGAAQGISGSAFIDISGGTLTMANTAGYGLCGTILITNVGTSNTPLVLCQSSYVSNGAAFPAVCDVAGQTTSAQTYTSIQFSMSSGNISTGIISVYGIL